MVGINLVMTPHGHRRPGHHGGRDGETEDGLRIGHGMSSVHGVPQARRSTVWTRDERTGHGVGVHAMIRDKGIVREDRVHVTIRDKSMGTGSGRRPRPRALRRRRASIAKATCLPARSHRWGTLLRRRGQEMKGRPTRPKERSAAPTRRSSGPRRVRAIETGDELWSSGWEERVIKFLRNT